MDHWAEHTCLTFEEASDLSGPHLEFKKLSGCYSSLGRLWWQSGRDSSIGENCDRIISNILFTHFAQLGIVAHEIGHAGGFFHEQSASDRHSNIQVNEENIIEDKLSQFAMQTIGIDVYSVLYDYSSVMHYGSKYFTKNGKLTISTLDPLAQELIGSRKGLSHYDKLLANRMYSCIDPWLTHCRFESDPCQNYGYIGKNCACVCPPGSSGTNCDITKAGYYANQEVFFPLGTKCTKKIVAPECYSPRVTFRSFRLYGRVTCSDGTSCCYYD
ncbi:LOW QUALITY PROTEIN: protein SpAN-like [Penaeus vannamei]|uniref:LOW QUALITY PROTEIN: protein SpAN-like n=1 Tax=Penaeus vannamei TaxID=6689 RepID=UPI00387F75CC